MIADEKMSVGRPVRGRVHGRKERVLSRTRPRMLNNLKYILKVNFILLININNLSLYYNIFNNNVVINYYLNYLIFHFYFFLEFLL